MSNYSDNPAHVRVDFFKEHGKWYVTEVVDMTGHYKDLTVDAVKNSISQDQKARLDGLWAVCLDPYCEFSFPVMFKINKYT